MEHLLITTARYTVTDGGMACGPVPGSVIAEAGFKTPEGEEFYLTCVETMGIPTFMKTDSSIFEGLVKNETGEYDEELQQSFLEHSLDVGEYYDIFENKDPEWFDLLRYLIYIVGNDYDDTDEFINKTVGKYLDEIEIPVSSIEEAHMEDEDDELEEDAEDENEAEHNPHAFTAPKDRDSLYRARLSIETDIKIDSVFKDMDASAAREEKKLLKVLRDACSDEKDYKAWKKKYLDSEYEKVKDKKFLVYNYLFAGIGQYEMILPEEALAYFQSWINGSGSAFMGEGRDASKEEVRTYLALHANDKK